ncbi:N-acetylmuramic acid 6-phosphate etherase [Aquisalibacillus elongatus]|uniref:N-acetylmuramic acid 6-phosphate etherase n=1 Tax=Aquisalibacillus elongatus TaxID=485577 RepID=A0A3N5B6E4_9BACI|nr:N-acetylmuramic acid 6-phosphate etherase [Aquisalibacillus elongatus]RPF51090.1 N-acetylmuramic acid 6-phosphate etherase [Aquisalibacillus elongatus]
MELSTLTTEQRNSNSMNLDQKDTYDILKTIHQEDANVHQAIEKVLPTIEDVVEAVYQRLLRGGRLIYVGAGTSGRLGYLDSSECQPTFMTPPEMVQTIMAGGVDAFFQASEGSEDQESQGREDIAVKEIGPSDVVIGITSSGRTPYPIGAVKLAKEQGAFTVALTCNEHSEIGQITDRAIEVVVGPEVLTGSTRMKAATAHKMILNMISTTTMVKLGKVYENLMVDVQANNVKLRDRAKRIIMDIAKVTYEVAEQTLAKTNNHVKPAIVMLKGDVDYETANQALNECDGYVRDAIQYVKDN